VDDIEDNSTTTYTDSTVDTGLGQTSPPLAGDLNDDNSPPDKAGIVAKWKRTVFLGGFPDSPTSVMWSEEDEEESFPTLNVVNLDAPVTAMYETYSSFIIETELGKWIVSNDNPDYQFNKIIAGIGCVGRRAAGTTRVLGWAVDRDGLRLFDTNNPTKLSEVIRDKFDDDFDKSNLELMHTFHSKRRNLIGMFVADSNGDYVGENFIYQYPHDDIMNGHWWELDLPSSVDIQHVAEIEDTNGTFRLYGGGDDGQIYELFDEDEKNWATVSSTSAITTTFQTKWFRLGQMGSEIEGLTGRVQPRFIEVRATGDAATWVVRIDTANGIEQTTPTDTQSVSIPFSTNETILRYPVPAMQPGEYVRMTLTNSQADVASTVTGFRLYFHVAPFPGAIQTGDMNASA
jgi:hypothetical protein